MESPNDLVVTTSSGLSCPLGGFHIDPWGPSALALITHAHADHARSGSASYVCAEPCLPFVRRRLGEEVAVRTVPYRQPLSLGDTRVSFHPAGHVLGSSQIRIEAAGQVWVVSGDYKRAPDPTCEPFEVVPCDVFITEATFGLPIYRWEEATRVASEILSWWNACRARGSAALLFGYTLGKAERILAELARLTDRTVLTHGAVESLVGVYRQAGVAMLPTEHVGEPVRGRSFAGELILAPPSAAGSPWMRRFRAAETAFASGWMRVRGTRRRRNFDRGFALSDHADWRALLHTIEQTGAQRVLVTHGYAEELARYLRETGRNAQALHTAFEGEADA